MLLVRSGPAARATAVPGHHIGTRVGHRRRGTGSRDDAALPHNGRLAEAAAGMRKMTTGTHALTALRQLPEVATDSTYSVQYWCILRSWPRILGISLTGALTLRLSLTTFIMMIGNFT